MSRIKKFIAKLNGSVRGGLYEQTKARAVDLEKKYFSEAVKIENEIKAMLPDVSSLEIIYYIIFAKEISKLLKKHKTDPMLQELKILENKWAARGLSEENLYKIKHFYVGTFEGIFRFDISDLNGPDVLG